MVSSKIDIIKTTQTRIAKTKPYHTVHLGIYLGLKMVQSSYILSWKSSHFKYFFPNKVH